MRQVAVRVTPGAAKERVGDVRLLPDGQEQLCIYVTAPAEDGKANEAMLRVLAAHLGVAVSRLCVVRGATSRHKWVEVE